MTIVEGGLCSYLAEKSGVAGANQDGRVAWLHHQRLGGVAVRFDGRQYHLNQAIVPAQDPQLGDPGADVSLDLSRRHGGRGRGFSHWHSGSIPSLR